MDVFIEIMKIIAATDKLLKIIFFLMIVGFAVFSAIYKKTREKKKEMESNLPEPFSQQSWEPKTTESRTTAKPITKLESKSD